MSEPPANWLERKAENKDLHPYGWTVLCKGFALEPKLGIQFSLSACL